MLGDSPLSNTHTHAPDNPSTETRVYISTQIIMHWCDDFRVFKASLQPTLLIHPFSCSGTGAEPAHHEGLLWEPSAADGRGDETEPRSPNVVAAATAPNEPSTAAKPRLAHPRATPLAQKSVAAAAAPRTLRLSRERPIEARPVSRRNPNPNPCHTAQWALELAANDLQAARRRRGPRPPPPRGRVRWC